MYINTEKKQRVRSTTSRKYYLDAPGSLKSFFNVSNRGLRKQVKFKKEHREKRIRQNEFVHMRLDIDVGGSEKEEN